CNPPLGGIVLFLDAENRCRLGRERATQLAAEYRQSQRAPGRRAMPRLRRARITLLRTPVRAALHRAGLGGTFAVAFVLGALALAQPAAASGTAGTSLPPGFPTILDASRHTPLLGFPPAGR